MAARPQAANGDTRGPFRSVVDVQPGPRDSEVEVLACGHSGQVVSRYGPATKRRCAPCLADGVVDRIMDATRKGAVSHAEREAEHLRRLRAWQETDEAKEVDERAREIRATFRVLPGGRQPDMKKASGG